MRSRTLRPFALAVLPATALTTFAACGASSSSPADVPDAAIEASADGPVVPSDVRPPPPLPRDYGHKIVISGSGADAGVNPDAGPAGALSTSFSPVLDDLQGYLKQMTGSEYVLSTDRTPPAIYITLSSWPDAPGDAVNALAGKGLHPFYIRGNDSLTIVANDEHGLSNGIYDYLERLGCRWLLPGKAWTVVPKRTDIGVTIDRLVAPDFRGRDFAGTGGYFSNAFGRLYAESQAGADDWETWYRRRRYGSEYSLGKAVGEAFIAAHALPYPDKDPQNPGDHTLQQHSEYLAKIDGTYSPLYLSAATAGTGAYVYSSANARYELAVPAGTGTHDLNTEAKLNAGSPDAVKLWTGWIVNNLLAARKSPDPASHWVTSVEPSDGMGYGNDYPELPGNGSGSDQTFYIANESAKAVNAAVPGSSVILLAYAGHADPPSFPLEPNVIVQVTPNAFRGATATAYLSGPEFIALWGTKAQKMAIYDYWSIPDWTHDEPTFDYVGVASTLRMWNKAHIEAVNAESTYSGGAMGLGHYVASQLMWDLGSDENAIVDDFFENAFGPAKAPMRRMMERWRQGYRSLSFEIGASLCNVSLAMMFASGNPDVAARVDDVARYVHYLRLRNELLFSSLSGESAAAQGAKASALAEWLFDIVGSRMVDTTREFDLLAYRGFPALLDEFHVHDPGSASDPPNGPGWARVRPLTHDELAALVADGISKYPAPDFVVRTFTQPLAPVSGALTWTAPTGDPWGTIMPTIASLEAQVVIPTGLATLPLRVSRGVDNRVSLRDASGAEVYGNLVTATSSSDWAELSIPVVPGIYHLTFSPSGGRASGYFQFQTWRGVPLILQSFLSPKSTPSPRLYFYVPANTSKVVFYYPDSILGAYGAGTNGPTLYDATGTPVPTELSDATLLVEAQVPPGQSGKIWSIESSRAPNDPFEPLTVPNAFSLEPGVLAVPADAL